MKNVNKEKIFDLVGEIRDGYGDGEPDVMKKAKAKARKLADQFWCFEEDSEYKSCLLIFKNSDIPYTQLCFTYNFGIVTLLYIPANFEVKDVKFHKGLYTFISQDEQVIEASFDELGKVCDKIQFGGKKTSKYIEDAFMNCHKPLDTPDYTDEKLGLFKFEYDYYGLSEYKTGKYKISILVYTDNADTLQKCMKPLHKLVDGLEEIDALGRNAFIEELSATAEELRKIELGGIYFYEDKTFDVIYDLGDGEDFEYVKASFNSKNKLIDTSMGNY